MHQNSTAVRRASGFTLIEVVLVLVLTLILSAVSLPYFAGAYKGTKLRNSGRVVSRMARYARSMAIMKEVQYTLVLNTETMELFLGSATAAPASTADGELDQDVLKRLGYVDGAASESTPGIEKEIHRLLPEGISVRNFKKNQTEEDEQYASFDMVRYYPDGQSEWFVLELEDQKGLGIRIENDPVSGKVTSEFLQ